MKRFLSIIAGLIAGTALGAVFYGLPGKFLISAPIPADNLFLPEGVQSQFLLACLKYGVIPGAIVGVLGGLVTPLFEPRGHMTKGIGALTWLITTVLAWVTQWDNFMIASGSRKAIIIFVTLVSFTLAIPISHYLGDYVERMRE